MIMGERGLYLRAPGYMWSGFFFGVDAFQWLRTQLDFFKLVWSTKMLSRKNIKSHLLKDLRGAW